MMNCWNCFPNPPFNKDRKRDRLDDLKQDLREGQTAGGKTGNLQLIMEVQDEFQVYEFQV